MSRYHCDCEHDAAGHLRRLCETCGYTRNLERQREARLAELEAELARRRGADAVTEIETDPFKNGAFERVLATRADAYDASRWRRFRVWLGARWTRLLLALRIRRHRANPLDG